MAPGAGESCVLCGAEPGNGQQMRRGLQQLLPADAQMSHNISSQGAFAVGIFLLLVNGITFKASFQGLVLHDSRLLFSCHVPFKYVTPAVTCSTPLSFAVKSNCSEWHLDQK